MRKSCVMKCLFLKLSPSFMYHMTCLYCINPEHTSWSHWLKGTEHHFHFCVTNLLNPLFHRFISSIFFSSARGWIVDFFYEVWGLKFKLQLARWSKRCPGVRFHKVAFENLRFFEKRCFKLAEHDQHLTNCPMTNGLPTSCTFLHKLSKLNFMMIYGPGPVHRNILHPTPNKKKKKSENSWNNVKNTREALK